MRVWQASSWRAFRARHKWSRPATLEWIVTHALHHTLHLFLEHTDVFLAPIFPGFESVSMDRRRLKIYSLRLFDEPWRWKICRATRVCFFTCRGKCLLIVKKVRVIFFHRLTNRRKKSRWFCDRLNGSVSRKKNLRGIFDGMKRFFSWFD